MPSAGALTSPTSFLSVSQQNEEFASTVNRARCHLRAVHVFISLGRTSASAICFNSDEREMSNVQKASDRQPAPRIS